MHEKQAEEKMEPEEAGKIAFICYRQLEELLRVIESYGSKTTEYGTLPSCLVNYNDLLNKLRECFSIDPSFAEAIEHLKAIPTDVKAYGGNTLWGMLKPDAYVLRGSLHAFIELYLTPEEKKKTIGFQA